MIPYHHPIISYELKTEYLEVLTTTNSRTHCELPHETVTGYTGVELKGTVDRINSFLEYLSYTAHSEYEGNITISIQGDPKKNAAHVSSIAIVLILYFGFVF